LIIFIGRINFWHERSVNIVSNEVEKLFLFWNI